MSTENEKDASASSASKQDSSETESASKQATESQISSDAESSGNKTVSKGSNKSKTSSKSKSSGSEPQSSDSGQKTSFSEPQSSASASKPDDSETKTSASASTPNSSESESSHSKPIFADAHPAPAAPQAVASSSNASPAVNPAAENTSIQAESNAGRREDRRGLLENVNKTCDYIGQISRDKSLHFRASDKITSRLLVGAFILALGFATLPYFEMNAVAVFAYILADILLFGAIFVFVISRFGIIRAMEPRHALVCWHLMVGTGLLALVVGFNVVSAVVLIMMRERLQLLFPGG